MIVRDLPLEDIEVGLTVVDKDGRIGQVVEVRIKEIGLWRGKCVYVQWPRDDFVRFAFYNNDSDFEVCEEVSMSNIRHYREWKRAEDAGEHRPTEEDRREDERTRNAYYRIQEAIENVGYVGWEHDP